MEICNPNTHSQEDENALAQRMHCGDTDALHQLILANRGWVVLMARRYARVGVAEEDLVGEGIVGLLDAAQRFDPKFGTKFATYARYWVRARMLKFISVNRRAVASPGTRIMRSLRLRLNRTRHRLEQEAGGRVDDERVALELGVSTDDVVAARGVFSGHDVPVSPDPNDRGYEPLSEDSPEERVARSEEQHWAGIVSDQALEALTTREAKIVRERIMCDRPRTLRELGEEFGVSRERVRQIQCRAVHKMRAVVTAAEND